MKIQRILFVLIVLAIGLPGVLGAQDHELGLAVNTQGFVGAKLAYQGRVAPELWLGAQFQVSALLLGQADFDAGELGASLRYRGASESGWVASGGLVLGYRYQNQDLGMVHNLFADLDGVVAYRLGALDLGLELGWRQALLTRIEHSAVVRNSFGALHAAAEPAPAALYTDLALAAGVLRVGPRLDWRLDGSLALGLGLGYRYAPNPWFGGFEGMMFGYFPFYAELGASLRF